jgi:hypothetical protein
MIEGGFEMSVTDQSPVYWQPLGRWHEFLFLNSWWFMCAEKERILCNGGCTDFASQHGIADGQCGCHQVRNLEANN